MNYLSRGEVAELLGVSTVTIWRWSQKLGIEPKRDAYDARLTLYSEEDVERLREAVDRNTRKPQSSE